MREIKFHIYDKENKKYYSDVNFLSFCIGGIRFHWVDKDTQMVTELKDGSYELLQFTGLKDKNGREIFEGNIVHIGDMDRQVVFIDAKFQLTGIDKIDNAFYDLQPSEELVIIGNIYENPELLKEVVK